MFNISSTSNTAGAQTNNILYCCSFFSYLLRMMKAFTFVFALASANVWASPEKAEKCEGCKYEKAAVVVEKGNIVFKGALPEVVLREVRTVPLSSRILLLMWLKTLTSILRLSMLLGNS